MNLRPYQLDAEIECRKQLMTWQRVILCSPTGSGKTVTFCSIAKQAVERGKRVMILCDRKELITQAANKAKSYGLFPTIIAPGFRQSQSPCYVASVDTLVRREAPAIDLLIVDEAHKRKFDKVLTDIYPNVRTIGATATPIRPAKHSLHTLYGAIVEPTTISKLVAEGYLVEARTYGVKQDYSHIKQSYNAETGEYDYDSNALFNEFNKSVLYAGVVEQYIKFAFGTQCIVFNINVQHSKRMAEEFNAKGIQCYHVDGNTPDIERKRIFADFEAKKFQVLCNCGIATTGYDNPSIVTIIVNRATSSLALWLQMCGRGSRPYEGKSVFNIIDMGGNVYKHGFWQQERVYQLYTEKKRQTESFTPVKNCEQCDALVLSSLRVCNWCGYQFPKKERELVEAEFTELNGSIISKDKFVSKPSAQLWRLSDEELIKYGEQMGYKPGWANRRIQIRQAEREKKQTQI